MRCGYDTYAHARPARDMTRLVFSYAGLVDVQIARPARDMARKVGSMGLLCILIRCE